MIREVILRQLGETMDAGTISAWHKRVGERVEKGEPLVSVETDKAVIDMEADSSGFLVRIDAEPGQSVPVLRVIAYVADAATEVIGGSAPAASTPAAAVAPSAAPASTAATEPAEGDGHIKISPVARKAARAQGLDYSRLVGSGPGGRIIEADVLRAITQREAAPAATAPVVPAAPSAPAAPAAPAPVVPAVGDFELVPLTRMRRIIADRLAQSYRESVHVTLHAEVDMAEATKLRATLIEEWQPKQNVRLTFTDVIVKAVAKALSEQRDVNACYTPEGIHRFTHVNVGVAAALPTGLVVPVVRDADTRSLLEVARTVRTLTERARAGQLTPDEMHGGTFTVTNMGMLGIDGFTPIINPGEGAILGVGRIVDRVVARDGAPAVRPMMELSLSIDHRLIDGAAGAAFLARVRQILGSPYLVLV
jgi:pyruvate dehydrogenase E2 component (dihydrolipoamide acetyltransferase)